MHRKIVKGLIPALLVLLFVYTGFNKLFGLNQFMTSLYNQPIPHWLAFSLAWLIPVIEILTAGCLLFPATQQLGMKASLVLMSVFTVYIAAIMLHFFRKIPCSCAGIFPHVTWLQHLLINLLFLTLSLLGLNQISKKHSPLNHSI